MMSLLGLSLPMSSKCNTKLTLKRKALHLKTHINDNNEDNNEDVLIIKIQNNSIKEQIS